MILVLSFGLGQAEQKFHAHAVVSKCINLPSAFTALLASLNDTSEGNFF